MSAFILSDEERRRFEQWLLLNAHSDAAMAEQVAKIVPRWMTSWPNGCRTDARPRAHAARVGHH